jgi:Spy/CpxP family protein refolding chaperone
MVSTRRFKSYGVLVAVFLLGGAAGAGATYASVQHRYARIFSSGDGEFMASRRLDGLSRKLDLDASQREKVREIMTRHREKRHELARKMFESCGEPLQKDKTEMDAEIRAVLRPEQLSLWDQVVAAQRDHFAFGPDAFGGERGGGRRGPGGPR